MATRKAENIIPNIRDSHHQYSDNCLLHQCWQSMHQSKKVLLKAYPTKRNCISQSIVQSRIKYKKYE